MQALILIDIQNDYFPGGKSELVGADRALERIKAILLRFREANKTVLYVQHINTRSGATFFIPNTFGVEIHPEIAPLKNEPVIIKHLPNSFYQTDFLDILKANKVSELVICGMMTHMCIDTTVRAAKDYGFPVTLLYDACATKDLVSMGSTIPADTVHKAYMAGLSGMFAKIILTDQFEF